jgi:hypothetical protein
MHNIGEYRFASIGANSLGTYVGVDDEPAGAKISKETAEYQKEILGRLIDVMIVGG